jgi:hypothetical protein
MQLPHVRQKSAEAIGFMGSVGFMGSGLSFCYFPPRKAERLPDPIDADPIDAPSMPEVLIYLM